MKKFFNISLLILLALPLVSQVRQERDYKRSFAVPENAKVEVISKYGEVIVQSWDQDSVRFEVVVRAEGKNSAVVAKSMAKVKVKIRKVARIITAVTEISRRRGIF